MRIVTTTALALAAMLAACSTAPKGLGGTQAVAVVNADTLPPPTAADKGAGDTGYVIGPTDKLTVEVLGEEQLGRRELQVDPAGNISVPLAGTIAAAGRTPAQVRAAIEAGLRAGFIRNPRVAVNVVEAASQTVTVDGEVRTPGVYPVGPQMTLMRAVAQAQGLSDLAKLDDVVVFRTVGGRKLAALYNLGMIRRAMYADPTLYPGDLVVVGRSEARRLFKDVLAASGLVTTPLIVALQ